jgi:hypothetical protein
VTVQVGHAEVRLFAARLQLVAPTARRELRPKIREAAGELTAELKRESSWSSRIPGAVYLKTGFGPRSSGVRVGIDARKAPHARPLEFPNRGGMVRHPVHGNREVWVETPARPFFFRAVSAKQDAVFANIDAAIDEAVKGL